MTTDDDFSVESARRASEQGRLADWVVDFLCSTGSDNPELAAAFAFSGAVYLGPVRLPLDQLTPLAGPEEEDVVVPVAEEEWEADIEHMEHSVADGWHPPPLLVSHRQGTLFIEDGNHRVDALRRLGETDGWAILAFADDAERDAFVTEAGDPA